MHLSCLYSFYFVFYTMHDILFFLFSKRYTPISGRSVPPTNFWQAFKTLASWIDTFSWDPKSHPFFLKNQDCLTELLRLREANRQKVGLLKDESPAGSYVESCIALRLKNYCIKFTDSSLKKTAKV